MEKKNVAVLVGSLRRESYNRKMAKALLALAPEALRLEIIEIGGLPFYSEDLEKEGPPAAWTEFRQALLKFDAFLFVTPEYNRSVPAVLKNAIDVGSRPHGKSVWNGKPGAVMSVSPGAIGGLGPTTTCASRWCSSMSRPCSSRRPTSAMPRPCSTTKAHLPMIP